MLKFKVAPASSSQKAHRRGSRPEDWCEIALGGNQSKRADSESPRTRWAAGGRRVRFSKPVERLTRFLLSRSTTTLETLGLPRTSQLRSSTCRQSRAETTCFISSNAVFGQGPQGLW
ncbi:hypothetical protein MKZ38_004834 [Zalerion maritima]|uniref:Uncharacterized protein n=1 Tax=Zalerion maritima TaxID=339359 RepID=A0AAD5WQS9_9PEZI|nr:hypothetical protein MKZ38_004834 [Zalerion maritima]